MFVSHQISGENLPLNLSATYGVSSLCTRPIETDDETGRENLPISLWLLLMTDGDALDRRRQFVHLAAADPPALNRR